MLWRIVSRTWLWYTGIIIEGLLAFLCFFITIVLYGQSIPVGEKRTTGDFYIYVKSNGVHTDVCLPTSNEVIDWTQFLPLKDFEDNIPSEFVTIGWGDKGFFLDTPEWKDLTINTAFNAVALPSAAAMHISYDKEPMENEYCTKVYLTKKQYQNLVFYVKVSFQLKNNKVDLIPDKGYGQNDNFYEAKNSYHLFRTCNTWTNDALKEANVRTSLFAVFPNGIMKHLK